MLVSASANRKETTRQQGELASDPGNLNCVFVLFCYKILLFVDKFICECAQLKEYLNFTVWAQLKEISEFSEINTVTIYVII